ADIIVGVALKREGYALGKKRAEALARRAVELEADGVVRQALRSVPPGNFAAQHRADRPVNVADRQLELDACAVLDGIFRVVDQLVIECVFQSMVLCDLAAPPDSLRYLGIIEDRGKVQPARFPMFQR